MNGGGEKVDLAERSDDVVDWYNSSQIRPLTASFKTLLVKCM